MIRTTGPLELSPPGPYRNGDRLQAAWTIVNAGSEDIDEVLVRFHLPDWLVIDDETERRHNDNGGIPVGTLRAGCATTPACRLTVRAPSGDETGEPRASAKAPAQSEQTGAPARARVIGKPRLHLGQPSIILEDDAVFRIECDAENSGDGPAHECRARLTVPPACEAVLPEPDEIRTMNLHIGTIGPNQTRKAVFTLRMVRGEHTTLGPIALASDAGTELRNGIVGVSILGTSDLSRSLVIIEEGCHLTAGTPVTIAAYVRNDGRGAERECDLRIDLPDVLMAVQGSLRIDESPPRATNGEGVGLGTVGAGETRIVRMTAVVRSPCADGQTGIIKARAGRQELKPFRFDVAAAPRFGPERNNVRRDGDATIGAGKTAAIEIRIENTGSDAATATRIRLAWGNLELAETRIETDEIERADEGEARKAQDEAGATLDLGQLEPGQAKTVRMSLRAPDRFADGTEFPVHVWVRCRDTAEQRIGSVAWTGTSRESLSIRLENEEDARLQPGDQRSIAIILKNEGAADAEDVEVEPILPAGLVLASVTGLDRRGDAAFGLGRLGAGAEVRGKCGLRLERAVPGRTDTHLGATVRSRRSSAEAARLVLRTESLPFIDEASARIESTADGLRATLTFANRGKAQARAVTIIADVPDGYLHGSTEVNGAVVTESANHCLLRRGIALEPVYAGGTVSVSYRLRGADREGFVARFTIEAPENQRIETASKPYRAPIALEPLPDFVRLAVVPPAPEAPPTEPAETPNPADPPTPVDKNASAAMEAPTAHEADEETVASPSVEATKEAVAESATAPSTQETSRQPTRPSIILGPRRDRERPDGRRDGTAYESSSPLKIVGRQKLDGPTGVMKFDAKRRQRAVTTIDALFRKELGWYRHVFGMRLFIPDRILGTDARIEDAWETVKDGVEQDFKKPFMRTTIGTFVPTLEWSALFGNEAGSNAMNVIMESMPEIIDLRKTYPAPAFDEDELYGTISEENFTYFNDIRERATIHHVNALLPETIPNTSRTWPNLGDALEEYRHEAAKIFKSISITGDEQRHLAMTKRPNADMDDRLRHVQMVIENEVMA